MVEFPYRYAWKNNPQFGLFPCPKRCLLYGRHMKVLVRGKQNSALVEFADGRKEVISRNAIRKVKRA